MDSEKFIATYGESRNGANFFVRHWAVRKFQYTDGVKDCVDCGLHWFLDLVATEAPVHLRIGDMGIIELNVGKGVAKVSMTLSDDKPPVWVRASIHTDAPEGTWTFYLAHEGERYALILPTEY